MPPPCMPWPPRRQNPPAPPQPPAPPAQRCLPLEPSADEVLAEVRRIWQCRPFFRRRFKSLQELLADPQRQRVLMVCARQALLARARRQPGGRAGA